MKYATFIISYKRPTNQKTLDYILSAGYSGTWYIVVDDRDPTIEEYKALYADHILVFSKEEMLKITDNPIYPPELNFAVYARNACEQFANKLELDSFIVLDDDIKSFSLRYDEDGFLRNRKLVNNITEIFENILLYMLEANVSCASSGYQNIYWGGVEKFTERDLKDSLRLPIEAYFRNNSFKVNWVNLMGEDLVSGVKYGREGQVWLMLPFLQVVMPPCLKLTEEGGHTDTYKKYSDIGLNVFFKIWQPNAFTVFLKGDQWCHSVRKDYAVPKIVRS